MAKLLDDGKGAKWLNKRWSVEIDKKKMVKAVRMPLGFAAKMYVMEGDVDRHGNTATYRPRIKTRRKRSCSKGGHRIVLDDLPNMITRLIASGEELARELTCVSWNHNDQPRN